MTTVCHPSCLVTFSGIATGKSRPIGVCVSAVAALPTDPIGSTTVTFSGVHAGTEIRVYLPDGTEAAGVETCDANHVLSWQVYAAGSANNTVSITLLLRGYRWQKFAFTSTVGTVNLPIFQITDLGYSNPV